MLCGRTLQEAVSHLGCSLNDLEGSELYRIAQKNSGQGSGDSIDFTFDGDEDSLNHIRWSEKFLTSCINDAYRILHKERPDLFTKRIRYKLKPGCRDQALDCCKFVGDLRNDSCDDSTPVDSVSKNQMRTAEKLGRLFCKGSTVNSSYRVTAYNFNPKAPNEFTVEPPPPRGQDSYVSFNCVQPPPCFEWPGDSETSIGDCLLDDYEPWFIEYALFRAHMSDRESETSRQVAETHWTNGFKMITDGKSADYAFYHPDLYLIGPISGGTGERIVLQPSN